MSKRSFQVGDVVTWTGKANGSEKEHVGTIKLLRLKDVHYAQPYDQAVVVVNSTNKRTGKANNPKTYEPRLSALALVRAANNAVSK